MQFLHDMHGLSTQACETFIELYVLESVDEALQWDRDKELSIVKSLSTLQYLALLTVPFVYGLPHVGEVEEVENSSRPEVEGEQSSSSILDLPYLS